MTTPTASGVEPDQERAPATLVLAYFRAENSYAWRRLLKAPPDVVVVDVEEGPGEERDPALAPLVSALLATDAVVLGRVDTGFGKRPLEDVRADLRAYRSWYGLRGVYLDRAAAGEDLLDHYREIVDGVRGMIALNPAAYPDPGYAQLADMVVTFDGPLSAYGATREPAWARDQPRGRFCQVIQDVPEYARAATLRGAARLAGTVAVTDRAGSAPWSDLPAYYDTPIVAG
ncbi:spherulation-specific family 4 protein [Nonomuraea sediminis]|uniref:spherulation-specific family 4 protein n=1 Tax=Nonomuraea sediminis TaxID=2835864 RepID=UPI001BDCEEA4|nr:spherulation-specific family 4 protein [Nonomuraea sediminis]